MDFEGLTGRVQFDNGERKSFNLDIVELGKTGLEKVNACILSLYN